MDELMTLKEVCAALRIHRNTVWKMVRSGKLKCFSIGCGRIRRYRKRDVEALFAPENNLKVQLDTSLLPK